MNKISTNHKIFLAALALLWVFMTINTLVGAEKMSNWIEVAKKTPSKPATVFYHDQVPEAVSHALKAKRPLLVVFGAGWCGPCRQLHRTLETKRFDDMLRKKYIVLYMDIDGKDKKWIIKHFGKFPIPRMEVVDIKNEKSLKQFTGYSPRGDNKLFKALNEIKLK